MSPAKTIGLILLTLMISAACASQPAVTKDSPAGKWSGDYGPDSEHRDSITVDLQWEGADLHGVVNTGTRSLPITKASFKADTGDIIMEFDAQGNGGRTVHYSIEGKVAGNIMSGTWTHDTQHGDFRVTKK